MDTTQATSRILEILSNNDDYAVSFDEELGVFSIEEADSGILIQARLEDNILLFQLPCIQMSSEQLTLELQRKMLAADNGISTSNFQIIGNNGTVTIVLTNFAILQGLGADDEDDINSCVEFLLNDLLAARDLISG